jgi:hypothetical protein
MQDDFNIGQGTYEFAGQGTRQWNPRSPPRSFQLRAGLHSGSNPKTGYVWETYGGGFYALIYTGRLSNHNNTLAGTWKIANGDRRIRGTFVYRRLTASILSFLHTFDYLLEPVSTKTKLSSQTSQTTRRGLLDGRVTK